MDMNTNTTAQLAAEGAETPARAATTMRKSRAEGKIDQAPAAVMQEPTAGQEGSREEFSRTTSALVDLLMRVEALSEDERARLDVALACYSQDHTSDSAHSVWAKIAEGLRAIHERFRVSYSTPDGDIENDIGPAGSAYRAAIAAAQSSAGQMAALRAQIAVERYAKHIAANVYGQYAINPTAVPELAGRIAAIQNKARGYSTTYAPLLSMLAVGIVFTSKPSPDLARILAEAKEIAKDIGPAQDAFHEANEAWIATKGKGEDGLLARQNELESVWWSHLNRFSANAERLFDLPISTTADRARIVRAYADLMAPVFGDTDLDNKLAGLPTENLLEVISYLDGTRPKTLTGRDEIRAAGISAKAAQDENGAWEQLDAAARAAEDGLRGASTTVRRFEDQNPTSGDGDPAYDKLTAAWDEANSTLFRTYHELLNMPAPDVATMARQIQVYSWVTNVTDHRIDGKTSWPLDPAEPKMEAAIDEAGDDDERGLLSLYRSACRLAGVELQPIRIEAEVAAKAELLAAE